MKFSKNANILFLAGICVSILSIALGLIIGTKSGSINQAYISYAAFGGDFYTEIHAAARGINDSIGDLINGVGFLINGIGFLLDILGGFGICFFGGLFCLEKNDTPPTDTAISADSSTSKTNENEERKIEETEIPATDKETQEPYETNKEK